MAVEHDRAGDLGQPQLAAEQAHGVLEAVAAPLLVSVEADTAQVKAALALELTEPTAAR